MEEPILHPGCDGSGTCPAPAHVHGCYNDLLGHCDDPGDHDADPTEAVASSISEALGWEEHGHTTPAASRMAVDSVVELMTRKGEPDERQG